MSLRPTVKENLDPDVKLSPPKLCDVERGSVDYPRRVVERGVKLKDDALNQWSKVLVVGPCGACASVNGPRGGSECLTGAVLLCYAPSPRESQPRNGSIHPSTSHSGGRCAKGKEERRGEES